VFGHDLDPDNEVGAPYVLLQAIPGHSLKNLWGRLSLESKRSALSQIASVVVQLASLKFNGIGCLDEEGVGALISPSLGRHAGVFESTSEYLASFVSPDSVESPQLRDAYRQVQEKMDHFLDNQGDASYLQPPFCMVYSNFSDHNTLFTTNNGTQPMLSGLTSLDYAYTGPLYFLYEYPSFIRQGFSASFRDYFVREIHDQLPDAQSRATFISCMNAKSFALNGFRDSFMAVKRSEDEREELVTALTYLHTFQNGYGLVYPPMHNSLLKKYASNGDPLPFDPTA
jgi:hypothetical protein